MPWHRLGSYALRDASPFEEKAITLPMLVRRIEMLLADMPTAGPLFRNRLLEAGFLDHAHPHTVAFTVTTVPLYKVGEGFPRLIPAQLPAGNLPVVSILVSSIALF